MSLAKKRKSNSVREKISFSNKKPNSRKRGENANNEKRGLSAEKIENCRKNTRKRRNVRAHNRKRVFSTT